MSLSFLAVFIQHLLHCYCAFDLSSAQAFTPYVTRSAFFTKPLLLFTPYLVEAHVYLTFVLIHPYIYPLFLTRPLNMLVALYRTVRCSSRGQELGWRAVGSGGDIAKRLIIKKAMDEGYSVCRCSCYGGGGLAFNACVPKRATQIDSILSPTTATRKTVFVTIP